ncbi:hypothetical protein [Paracoccus sp. SY]|uniref:hypothetical protein n=1 Tax=Paracoccus sp. SY TaxID=1330255 RepID=UPI000CD23361|nr:hypothetical protein [Paracoccus sp. SY]
MFGPADIASLGHCSRRFGELRYEGRYAPPSLQGTLAIPATAGGNSIIKPQVADQPVAFALPE